MKTTMDVRNGRPKSKEGRRNFKFPKDVNDFLETERARTGKAMTAIIEQSLLYMARLKPAARDALLSNLRKAV